MYNYGLGASTACFPCNQTDSWQQLIAAYSPLSGHKQLDKLEII